ncbi:MAG: type II toxin-antitoxin system VapC family toxin [Chloroflexi bacterium]|nr:type II toxin-antitoxin system VapC family toxin [Chloroflexota bacterium]
MSGNRCLLDTNIVVAILNQEPSLANHLTGITVYLSAIVLGELYFGAHKSARITDNLARIETFVAQYPVLDCSKTTASHYGQIKQKLAVKGRPIPENDIWISALAVQYGLTLVTRDDHFKQVDGLLLETW